MNNDRLQAAAEAYAAKFHQPNTVGFHQAVKAFKEGALWLFSEPLADRITPMEVQELLTPPES